MTTVRMNITHAGTRSQIIPAPGGTITIHPGQRIPAAEINELSEDRIAHYRERGVTFTGLVGRPKGSIKVKDEDEAAGRRKGGKKAKPAVQEGDLLDGAGSDIDPDADPDAGRENDPDAGDEAGAGEGGQ
jgi:hypothetical protein